MKIFRVIFMSKLAFHTGQRSLLQVISRLIDPFKLLKKRLIYRGHLGSEHIFRSVVSN